MLQTHHNKEEEINLPLQLKEERRSSCEIPVTQKAHLVDSNVVCIQHIIENNAFANKTLLSITAVSRLTSHEDN